MFQTKKLVLAALFAALTCVATMVITVPLPTGYANLGDCIVLLGAYILGPAYGAAAAGIGAMLADLFAGYGIYAPATLVIKALMALAAVALFRKKRFSFTVLGIIAAEAVMVAGYFLYELLLGNAGAAVASVFGNVMQGLVGGAAAVVLIALLKDKIRR